jgi:hypothetical protein
LRYFFAIFLRIFSRYFRDIFAIFSRIFFGSSAICTVGYRKKRKVPSEKTLPPRCWYRSSDFSAPRAFLPFLSGAGLPDYYW